MGNTDFLKTACQSISMANQSVGACGQFQAGQMITGKNRVNLRLYLDLCVCVCVCECVYVCVCVCVCVCLCV